MLDNIGPVSSASNVIKLIEMVLHSHIMKFVSTIHLLGPVILVLGTECFCGGSF